MIDLYVLGLVMLLLVLCIYQQIEISELREDRTRIIRQVNEIKRSLRELYELTVSE